jgi:hypothetical protein
LIAAAVFPRWIEGPFDFADVDQLGGSLDGMLTEFAVLSLLGNLLLASVQYADTPEVF